MQNGCKLFLSLLVLLVWKLFPASGGAWERQRELFTDAGRKYETTEILTHDSMDTRKLTTAFAFIFIGTLFCAVPLDHWTGGAMYFIACVFLLIGKIRLVTAVEGIGRIGAILWLASSVLGLGSSLLGLPFQIQSAFSSMASSTMGGFGLTGFPETAFFFEPTPAYLGVMSGFYSIGGVLSLAAFVCWLFYKPFARMLPALVLLLIVSVAKLPFWPMSGDSVQSVQEGIGWVSGLLTVIALYIFVIWSGGEDRVLNRRIRALLFLAMGAVFSFYILLNNGYKFIAVAFLGIVLWLVGTGGIRAAGVFFGCGDAMAGTRVVGDARKGTGAFVAYGILMAVSLSLHLIPTILGDILAALLQIPAYIVLSVGFSRFRANPMLPGRNGMRTLSTLAALLTVPAVIYCIPWVGEGISALLFVLLFVPILIPAWVNALGAAARTGVSRVFPTGTDGWMPVGNEASPSMPPLPPLPKVPDVPENNDSAYRVPPVSPVVPPSPSQRFAGPEWQKMVVDPADGAAEQAIPVRTEAPNIPVPPVISGNTGQPAPDGLSEGNASSFPRTPNPFPKAVLWVGLALLVAAGGILSYVCWYRPYRRDKEAPRCYTFAENTNLRSSQIAGIDYNRIATLPYGTELIAYEQGPEWSRVKTDGTTGYIASEFILPQADFLWLNGIFGDAESRACIGTAKCRLALLGYFKEKGYYGKPQGDLLYTGLQTRWQVFAKPENVKPNTVFFKRLYDPYSKFTDFAVIIRNTRSEERRLLLFSFDEDETPHLMYEEEAPRTGDIRDIVVKQGYGGAQVKVSYTGGGVS